jgi:hypothetical protein
LRYRPVSPPFPFLFIVEVRIKIEAAEGFEGTKTLASLDVFSKSLVYGSPFRVMASEALGFIK